MKVFRPTSAYALRRDGGWDDLREEIEACGEMEALVDWEADFILRRARTLPEGWHQLVLDLVDDQRGKLLNREMDREFGGIVSG